MSNRVIENKNIVITALKFDNPKLVKLVSNFKAKANHFNIFLLFTVYTPLDNNHKTLGNYTYVTDNKLSSL